MAFKAEPGGLGDKFRLLYTVATDQRASRAHVAVMGVILWRFNRDHGCCWPSIDSLAEDCSLDTRTVQRALESLEGWDYLHTLRNKGRLNRYVPHFQAQRSPQSNGVRTASSHEKGRHPRPQGTAFSSKSNGLRAVTPTAYTPPEYLNESIPEKEKRKSNGNGFSFGEETGKAESVSADGGLQGYRKFPEGSPERRAWMCRTMLETTLSFGPQPPGEYENRVRGIDQQYREACEKEGRLPQAEVLAKIWPEAYGGRE